MRNDQEIIFVVDDDPLIVEYVSGILTRAGYRTLTTSDSTQIGRLLREATPAAAVLDLNMPEVDGAELFGILRSASGEIEIIYLTGNDETEGAVELMRRGAADYLLKPVRAEILLISLERALEHRRLVRENRRYREHLEDTVTEKTGALNRALAELEHTYAATLETLGTALDFRDQSTSGHSRRVANQSVRVARRLGVSGDDLVQINYGAFLHDIGKLKIPDRILWKPGPLDGEEWVVMREHARYGYEFVRGIDFLKGAAEIVHAHHEKFNGAGYPRGLRGGDIPIGARIFAIVDAVDAMIYERPYQKALSFDAAQAEIRRSTGTHFDPDLAGPAIDVLAGGSGHDPAPAIPAKPA